MSKTRRNDGSAFKAKVALEVLKGEQTVTEIASKPDPYPHFTWRVESHRVELVRQVLESASPK